MIKCGLVEKLVQLQRIEAECSELCQIRVNTKIDINSCGEVKLKVYQGL